jgi:hypothetical protein
MLHSSDTTHHLLKLQQLQQRTLLVFVQWGAMAQCIYIYTVAYIPVSRRISAYANKCISLLVEHVL